MIHTIEAVCNAVSNIRTEATPPDPNHPGLWEYEFRLTGVPTAVDKLVFTTSKPNSFLPGKAYTISIPGED